MFGLEYTCGFAVALGGKLVLHIEDIEFIELTLDLVLEVLAEAAEAAAALEILAKLHFLVVESIEHVDEFDIVRSDDRDAEVELKTSIWNEKNKKN